MGCPRVAMETEILCTASLRGKTIPWSILIEKDKVGISILLCIFFESLDLSGSGVVS